MPEAVFRHRAVTSALPAEVWKRLQEPAVWAEVAGVEGTSDHAHDGAALAGFRFTTSIGGVSHRGTAEVTESRPEERMTLSIRSPELEGSIAVDLAQGQPGTDLDVTMTMRPNGMMATMTFPLIRAAVAAGFSDAVDGLAMDLARSTEGGDHL